MNDKKLIVSAYMYNEFYSKNTNILIDTPIIESHKVFLLEQKVKELEICKQENKVLKESLWAICDEIEKFEDNVKDGLSAIFCRVNDMNIILKRGDYER